MFVDEVVSVFDLLKVSRKAILPTFEHLLLDAEVAQMFRSVSNKQLFLLLLLVSNLLCNDLLMRSFSDLWRAALSSPRRL